MVRDAPSNTQRTDPPVCATAGYGAFANKVLVPLCAVPEKVAHTYLTVPVDLFRKLRSGGSHICNFLIIKVARESLSVLYIITFVRTHRTPPSRKLADPSAVCSREHPLPMIPRCAGRAPRASGYIYIYIHFPACRSNMCAGRAPVRPAIHFAGMKPLLASTKAHAACMRCMRGGEGGGAHAECPGVFSFLSNANPLLL